MTETRFAYDGVVATAKGFFFSDRVALNFGLTIPSRFVLALAFVFLEIHILRHFASAAPSPMARSLVVAAVWSCTNRGEKVEMCSAV